MELDSVGPVIAERELTIRDSGRVVRIEIGAPAKFLDGNDYYCPYRIIGLGDGPVRYAGGIDSIQALLLALRLVAATLLASEEAKSGTLMWEGDEQGGLGFPSVPGQ